LAAWGGTFDHSAVRWSPSIFTRYSLLVVADFHISGSAVAFGADFVLAAFETVWPWAKSCHEAIITIPHAKMMVHQNGFTFKESSSNPSALNSL
jgi:hypothetical protein